MLKPISYPLKYLFTLGFMILISSIQSQNEVKNWYFGYKAGLDFRNSPPNILTNSSIIQQEGCASISDAAGNLIFYTDGVTIWNRTHEVMSNGTMLNGNFSTTQSALIVKHPGNSNLYYVFTLGAGGTGSLYYSIVDISLAVGNGSVTVKNVFLAAAMTEKLAATKHCNGNDVWVMSHDINSNNFRCFVVTATGLNLTPVISAYGAINTGQGLGQLKFSPNGKKLGLANYDAGAFELYDFDNATGVVSNSLNLVNSLTSTYGCEFSPDGTKFYGTQGNGSYGTYQWDLCAGSNSLIVASQFSLAGFYLFQGMQLATDGKIYIAKYNFSDLGVINNPNGLGTACLLNNTGQSVAPGMGIGGFPNIISNFLKYSAFSYSMVPTSCQALSFSPPSMQTNSATCNAVANTITNFTWLFGDPASGPANTSTLSNPTHTFSGNGTYIVRLVFIGNCTNDTISQLVRVPSFNLTATSSETICPGQSVTLTCTGANSYTWSNSISTNSIVVSPSITTVYSVIASGGSSCSATPSITISVFTNSFSVSPPGPVVVCPGYSLTISAFGADTYTWSNYAMTNSIIISPTTSAVFSVSANFGINCRTSSLIAVNLSTTKPSVAGNFTICNGEAAFFTAVGATSYTWHTGVTSASISVTPSLTSIYSFTGTNTDGCIFSETFTVEVNTCTGSEDLVEEFRLKIFPNPCGNEFFIESETELKMTISNCNGQEVLIREVKEGTNWILIDELEAGIYIIKAISSRDCKTIKLIRLN